MTGEFLEDFEGSKLANLNTPFVRDLKRKKKTHFLRKKVNGYGDPWLPPSPRTLVIKFIVQSEFRKNIN